MTRWLFWTPRDSASCGTDAGSYLRLIDSCITQLKAQGPSRTCNESKEKKKHRVFIGAQDRMAVRDWGTQSPAGFRLLQRAPQYLHQGVEV